MCTGNRGDSILPLLILYKWFKGIKVWKNYSASEGLLKCRSDAISAKCLSNQVFFVFCRVDYVFQLIDQMGFFVKHTEG